jgi:hypothetical protein
MRKCSEVLCVRTKVVTLNGIEASGKGKVISVGELTIGVYIIAERGKPKKIEIKH